MIFFTFSSVNFRSELARPHSSRPVGTTLSLTPRRRRTDDESLLTGYIHPRRGRVARPTSHAALSCCRRSRRSPSRVETARNPSATPPKTKEIASFALSRPRSSRTPGRRYTSRCNLGCGSGAKGFRRFGFCLRASGARPPADPAGWGQMIGSGGS